jgi:hypothetical protein
MGPEVVIVIFITDGEPSCRRRTIVTATPGNISCRQTVAVSKSARGSKSERAEGNLCVWYCKTQEDMLYVQGCVPDNAILIYVQVQAMCTPATSQSNRFVIWYIKFAPKPGVSLTNADQPSRLDTSSTTQAANCVTSSRSWHLGTVRLYT